MKKQTFTPLLFLASLGAGGISVIPFALLQYTFPHGAGLITIAQIGHTSMTPLESLYFYSLEGIMLFFVAIHLILSIIFFKKLIIFIKSDKYQSFITNPITNAAILAPFISIVMTMNVFIGPVRYFSAWMAQNLQSMMLPALLFWIIIFISLMRIEIKLLKTAFEQSFDMSKVTFGWLLHPFALGMLSVTGAGIAAMAHDANTAHVAAFLTMIAASMGIFLFIVKVIAVFQKHFASEEGLGNKQFLPSFLIVIPSVTLYALTAFRLGHYFEHHHGAELDIYYTVVITGAFAFETWYMIFGLALLSEYFKKHYFTREYYITQWGLICPFVAYAVLGSFVYNVFLPSPFFYGLVLMSTFVAIFFYIDLLYRHIKCTKGSKKIQC